MQVLQIEIRCVYGAVRYYPANQAAQLFAQVAGARTLVPQQIRLAQQLGFQIEYVNAYASAEV